MLQENGEFIMQYLTYQRLCDDVGSVVGGEAHCVSFLLRLPYSYDELIVAWRLHIRTNTDKVLVRPLKQGIVKIKTPMVPDTCL